VQVADTLPGLLAFESGIANSFVKEIQKHPIQVLERLLQYLGVRFLQPAGVFRCFQYQQLIY
jgi:hypothetical protein